MRMHAVLRKQLRGYSNRGTLTSAGLARVNAVPVAQLHYQQRRAEEERDSIRQDDGQRMDHEAVADPQQEPYVEADQHEQREIADGLAAEGMQGQIGRASCR